MYLSQKYEWRGEIPIFRSGIRNGKALLAGRGRQLKQGLLDNAG
jgi:hypothetical protein